MTRLSKFYVPRLTMFELEHELMCILIEILAAHTLPYVKNYRLIFSRGKASPISKKSNAITCRFLTLIAVNLSRGITHWLERFDGCEKEVRALGYSDTFIRMWHLYFASCIAAFTTGRTDVIQVEIIHQ